MINPQLLEQTLLEWVNINTGSDNLTGLQLFSTHLEIEMKKLDATTLHYPLPPRTTINAQGDAVHIPVIDALIAEKRPKAPYQILLSGHLDTVFPKEHSFQSGYKIDNNTLGGPGCCDMKGGILIMLESLKWLENQPDKEKIGWQVVLTPDEEVGSPSSKELLTNLAKGKNIGMVFEPTLPNGHFVSKRKGSAIITLVFRGKGAHAGRHFEEGRNAINAMSEAIASFEALTDFKKGTTINIGHVQGGTGPNTIPDLAICTLNIRAEKEGYLVDSINNIKELAKSISAKREVEIKVHELTHRPPKIFDDKTEQLFTLMKKCANGLGFPFEWEATGGVCDGNFLAAAGLPTIDTLGASGGGIHTTDEFVYLDSIPKKVELIKNFLTSLSF